MPLELHKVEILKVFHNSLNLVATFSNPSLSVCQGCVCTDWTPGDAGGQSEDPPSCCPWRHPGQEKPHRHGRHGEVGLQPGQVREGESQTFKRIEIYILMSPRPYKRGAELEMITTKAS